MGSKGVAPLMLNLGARWGWMVNATPRSLYPRERTPVPIGRGLVSLVLDLDGYCLPRPSNP